MSTQDDLIGKHKTKTGEIFSRWLGHTDKPVTPKKIHRELVEIEKHRDDLIESLTNWVLTHHISDKRIKRLEKKKATLDAYGFEEYAKQQKLLPTADKTQKGNATEVILAEYLKFTSGLDLLIYRLRYNPNVDQSMKGDDVLLFDKDNLTSKIIVGEAKYRSVSSRNAVETIVSSFEGDKKLPMSIPFIAEQLSIMGEEELAEDLEDLNAQLHKLNTKITNVGLLFSNNNTSKHVEDHTNSSNESLIMLSLGTTNQAEIIQKCFDLAEQKLLKI